MAEFDWDRTGNESFTRSVISMPTHSFNWSVENVSKLSENSVIVCPKFYLSKDLEFYARLKYCMGGKSALSIAFGKCSGPTVNINHKYSITDLSGRVFKEHSVSQCYNQNNCDIQLSYFDTSDLENFLSDSEYDSIIIKSIMEWVEVYSERLPNKFRPKPASSSATLSEDLKAAFSASLYADVTLTVGDTMVRAHKLILCARSSVFARMFETRMQESEKNVVPVTDLELPVLRDMLTFLYTGVLAKDDFESVYALYYAADKYDVPSLRKTCSDVLLSKLEVENACQVLALADRHSDYEFKDSVVHFVRFYFGKILKTSAFDDLETTLKSEVKALIGKRI